MVNHTYGVLFTDERFMWGSCYCVSLFILISGMLSYRSNLRHHYSYSKTVIHSLKKIVVAYIFATLIYDIFTYKIFDFTTFINNLILFNASGPLYYVLLYINLMLVSKILYNFVAFKTRIFVIKDITIGYCVVAIAYITTNYSNVLNIFGGGGKLLGGTYLFLFYLGMIFEKYKILNRVTVVRSTATMVIGGIAFLICWHFACQDRLNTDNSMHFGGFNPPGVTFMALALCMLLFCYGAFNLINQVKLLAWINKFISWLGSHTLYIFLFHRLWLDYLLRPYVTISNPYIEYITYYGVMIAGSMLIEFIFTLAVRVYFYASESGNRKSLSRPA